MADNAPARHEPIHTRCPRSRDVVSDSFVEQDCEADDLDVALVKRSESVTDEEEVSAAVMMF